MATFTSTLPDAVLDLLNRKAKELQLPKNKLIERALTVYLRELNKAEYVRSYRRMAEDTDLQQLAEEGMAEYLNQLKQEEA